MIIGVMSDTHDNLEKIDKAVEVLNERRVGIVVHCGDYIAPFVIKRLGDLNSKLIGVFGNNDGDKKLLLKFASDYGFEIHNQPHEIELGGKKLLLLHGLGGVKTTKTIVRAIAQSGEYDVVLYGHTHQSEIVRVGETLVLNPGEVFGMLYGKSTLALLDLEKLEVKLIEL